jgi:hypothetical protein
MILHPIAHELVARGERQLPIFRRGRTPWRLIRFWVTRYTGLQRAKLHATKPLIERTG